MNSSRKCLTISSSAESRSLDRRWSVLDGDSSRSDTAADGDETVSAAAPTNAPQHLHRQQSSTPDHISGAGKNSGDGVGST